MDDIIANKLSLLNKYISRIKAAHGDDFLTNQVAQDVATLNLIRACEVCLDVGLRLIKLLNLGLPQSNKNIFYLLGKHKIIPEELSENLQKMAGFRNIAIHEYEDVSDKIIDSIIKHHLNDFEEYAQIILTSDLP